MPIENPIEGEIVYLNTGSPPLTVENNRNDDIVNVVWFTGGICRRDAFHKAALYREGPSRTAVAVSAYTFAQMQAADMQTILKAKE
jgi:uncharacterized protein YodC (DUF2158 family)